MTSSSNGQRLLRTNRCLCAMIFLLPSLLLAHPGHYHPDETDEFDFLKATFLHSHGPWDHVFLVVALASLCTAIFIGKRPFKVGAILLALGSIIATQLV